MPDARVGACCRCLFGVTTATCTIILFLALFLPNSKPACSIDRFFIPALNKSANFTTTNHTLFFQLRFLNKNALKGIYYDPINLTFYYSPIPTVAVANLTVPGFYQGRKRNTRRRGAVVPRGAPWEAAVRAANGSAVRLRVDLATAVKYKFFIQKSKRKRLVVRGTVDVNNTGRKVGEKAIALKSGTPELQSPRVWVGISVGLTTFLFVFL